MAACSWLSFFHRAILGALAPTILKDTGLTAQQFASINAYFFVAYTLGNPLWGSILDYVGLRVGMLLGVAIWTAASVSHGWMTAFIGFAAARALLPRSDSKACIAVGDWTSEIPPKPLGPQNGSDKPQYR